MNAARRHPVSIVVALAAGVAVGLVGALADWSTGAVYLALLALILGVAAVALAGEQRRKGRRDQPPAGAGRPAARGR